VLEDWPYEPLPAAQKNEELLKLYRANRQFHEAATSQ
jgi:hypothetical protein